MILAECINIHQLRLESFHMLSRSADNFLDKTSWWAGVIDAAESIDIRLAQLSFQFGGRWDIHTTSHPTQAGQPTAFDYYHDIQAAKIWNQRRGTRIAFHEFLLEICENFQIPQENKHDLENTSVALLVMQHHYSPPSHFRKPETFSSRSYVRVRSSYGNGGSGIHVGARNPVLHAQLEITSESQFEMLAITRSDLVEQNPTCADANRACCVTH